MEQSRIESAIELLIDLREKQNLPTEAAELIDNILLKAQIIQALKVESLEKIDNLTPYVGLWTGLIDFADKLRRVIEQHVGAAPGCLPQDGENCVLLSNIISLKEHLSAGFFVFEAKINLNADRNT